MNPGGPPELGWAQLAVVAAVLGAIGLAQWWLRRRGRVGEDLIHVVATRSLGGKRVLALVDAGGRRFLLGMTDERIACLGELDPVAADPASREPGRFPGTGGTGLAPSAIGATAAARAGKAAAVVALIGAALVGWAGSAHAALPQLSFELGGNGDGVSTSIQLVLLFTLLSFAPALLIGVSAFVRIVIVLAFMRQAVGTPQMPPNQVMIALALFLTFFVMMPTLREVNAEAVVPYLEQGAPPLEAMSKGFEPLRAFMMRQTREKDLALFLGISPQTRPATQADVPPEIVVPAFLISELKTAFQISFLIYIPFLVLDMVVASILTSMGMITLPPVLISLPFKLMIFVLVDGWNLLVISLVRSFQ